MKKHLKRLRLPDGRFITRTTFESDESTLAKAKTGDIWKTKDGRLIVVNEMDTRHIVNTMRFLERQAQAIADKLKLKSELAENLAEQMFPIYGKMRQTLTQRLTQEAASQSANGEPKRRLILE